MENATFRYLQKRNTPVVFDIDGTLTSYNYGKMHAHIEGDEEEFPDIYKEARPLPLIQKYFRCHGTENIWCVSKELHELEASKSAFVQRYYGLEPRKIFYAKNDAIKLQILETLKERLLKEKPTPVYVDDDERFLAEVEEKTGFYTAHVTLFFEGFSSIEYM